MTNTIETIPGIYIGKRNSNFKTLIMSVLKKGNISDKYLSLLLTEESILIYSDVFTSDSVDKANNYQVYEQLGDLTGNKFIVWYIYERFPQLNCTEGVKVVARLRINYVAKQSFFKIAQDLGFWEYISATKDLRMRKMKSLLEDAFEAFIGATELILDRKIGKGFGYRIAYRILKGIFDELPISLKYEDLYDPKTRLKELSDFYTDRLGSIVYEETRDEKLTHSTVYRMEGDKKSRKVVIGQGSAALKSDAQQKAAGIALETLKRQGFSKPIPKIYDQFDSKGNIGKEEEEKDIHIDPEHINDLILSKDRTKYQNKYQTTLIAEVCRKRDLDLMRKLYKLKPNPNIPDTDGLKPLDLLFIGKTDEKVVKKILRRLIKLGCDMEMQESIFDAYFTKYKNFFFSGIRKEIKVV